MIKSQFFYAIIALVATAFLQTPAYASTTRIDFSGLLTFGTISNSGSFSGVLLADWDAGVVYDFYADVSYSAGQMERYSIFPNYDMVGVVQGSVAKQYWSDGTIKQYNASPETEFSVSRYHRDQNGNPSPVPDPDWEMVLEIEPRGIWAWSDDEYQIIPCGSPSGFCWDQVSAFNAVGTITSLTTSPVPLPAAFWLFFSGIISLATIGRYKIIKRT